jgi:hypothetical protein
MMLTCAYCHRKINKCSMDNRGLCVKSPLSDGKIKRRTKAERERDKRNGNQRG